jgi:hypothetical protein
MELNPTPTPDPTAVSPQQLDASSTHITAQPTDDPRWTSPQPPPNVGGSSAIPVFVVTTVCLTGTCLLGALLGSWILVMVGLIAALLVFHYFAWGWLYTRMIAAQQKEELLRLAEQDAKLMPDPQRSRHI